MSMLDFSCKFILSSCSGDGGGEDPDSEKNRKKYHEHVYATVFMDHM